MTTHILANRLSDDISSRCIYETLVPKELITSRYECSVCKKNMHTVKYKDQSDDYEQICQKKKSVNAHLGNICKEGKMF